MGVYDISGTALSAVYDKSGSVLSVAYAVDGTPLTPSPEPPTPPDVFRDTAIVTALPSINNGATKQGACTDGEYLYAFCYNTSGGLKYKIADGTYTVTALGWSVPYRHGNDMAFNSNNGHIYIAAMTSDGAVMELDTDWTYITTHYLADENDATYSVWALCYDQKKGLFYADKADRVLVYNAQFECIGSIPAAKTGTWTAQGMETDGDYIYRVWYNSNHIEVHSITGEFVKMITNPMAGEPEAMMYDWINDRYFMSKNSTTDVFYRVQIKQQ